jgi:hypothetical protein
MSIYRWGIHKAQSLGRLDNQFQQRGQTRKQNHGKQAPPQLLLNNSSEQLHTTRTRDQPLMPTVSEQPPQETKDATINTVPKTS